MNNYANALLEMGALQDALSYFDKVRKGKIELLAVWDRGQKITNGRGSVAFGDQVAQGKEIPHRFRHLLAIHDQVLGVQPIVRQGLARRCLALGDFILVVREDQVNAPRVDVEGFP